MPYLSFDTVLRFLCFCGFSRVRLTLQALVSEKFKSDSLRLDVQEQLIFRLVDFTVVATILVFMIADERRNRKPYAIPVRFLPYRSLTDAKLRELEVELEEVMRSTGMTVVGMCQCKHFVNLRYQLLLFLI